LATVLLLGAAGIAIPAALAEDAVADPKQWCAETADLMANGRLDEVPMKAVKASQGGIAIEAASGFLAVKPVIEAGKVRANAFLVEKNYNEAIRKVWHLILFGESMLYIRCSFVKADDVWTLFDLSFNTNEERIGLP
jgi:hypothetical protein